MSESFPPAGPAGAGLGLAGGDFSGTIVQGIKKV
uniref:Uncharacterized protein n=1 Tax=Anguilla anguilla TaxID=7936 RepID=A0A0E9U129_ANGAN